MARPTPNPEDIMLPPSPPEFAEPENKTGSNGLVESPGHQQNGTYQPTARTTSPIPPLNIIPRNHSSLPRTHLRSRSFAGAPGAPFMARAHSSPGLDSRGRYNFPVPQGMPSNLQELPVRRPSPLRTPVDESSAYPASGALNISETISEQPELHRTPRSTPMQFDANSTSPSLSPGVHNTFPRLARRRPASPLNPSSGAALHPNSGPTSSQTSPLIIPTKFNEPYPSYSFSSGSSMPSTPSSIRSRSPSISSLETIPDIPDAEAAAIEADQIARLKAAADKADAAAAAHDMGRRRSAFDVSGSPSSRFGVSRKRWSVCGAEGRQDLDLETIWED